MCAPLEGDCDTTVRSQRVGKVRYCVRMCAPLEGDCDFQWPLGIDSQYHPPCPNVCAARTRLRHINQPASPNRKYAACSNVCARRRLRRETTHGCFHRSGVGPNVCAARRRLRRNFQIRVSGIQLVVRMSAPLEGDCDAGQRRVSRRRARSECVRRSKGDCDRAGFSALRNRRLGMAVAREKERSIRQKV
jgi:hypothetical protein